MRVTIIVDDNLVYVDGKARAVDCSPLIKDGIHAVQWYEAFGEEEFRNELDTARKALTRKPNNTITDFSPYQPYVELWRTENAKQELIEAKEQKRLEEQQQWLEAEQRRLEEWERMSPEEKQEALIAQAPPELQQQLRQQLQQQLRNAE